MSGRRGGRAVKSVLRKCVYREASLNRVIPGLTAPTPKLLVSAPYKIIPHSRGRIQSSSELSSGPFITCISRALTTTLLPFSLFSFFIPPVSIHSVALSLPSPLPPLPCIAKPTTRNSKIQKHNADFVIPYCNLMWSYNPVAAGTDA